MNVTVMLIRLVASIIGICLAYLLGKWLQKRTDNDSAMLWAIVAGRVLLVISDIIVDSLVV